MSTEASEIKSGASVAPPASTTSTAESHSAAVPKEIVNAQTVCNVKNEKGKLCNGHIKQLHTGGEAARVHLRGEDVLYKCQSCGTLYMGPPLGHVRDPDKQARFVQAELTELLQAAGGTMPIIKKNDKGVFVLAEPATHAPAKPTVPAKPATTAAAATSDTAESPEEKKARLATEAAARKANAGAQPADATKAATHAPASLGPIPGANGPVPGETFEQKLVRLRGVVAELKRRKELYGGDEGVAADAATGASPAAKTKPTLASTSGTDSSPSADEHRAEAEAQAATGQASAVPMSAATANASPAAVNAAPTAASSSRDFDTGPVPGETFEQKIARLKAVVAWAKERGDREGRVKP